MKPKTNYRRRNMLAAICAIGLAECIYVNCLQVSSQPKTSYGDSLKDSKQQDNFPPELMQQLESIKNAALGDVSAYQKLTHLTENIGPRPAGSAGAAAAVEYVAEQMRKLGLEVHLEECKVRHWVRGTETAELVGYEGRTAGTQQKIVVTALGGSTSTGAEGTTADVIVVDNFGQLESFARDRIVGRIVLFNEKFDKQMSDAGLGFSSYRETVSYRESGPQLAARLGAVGVLVRSIGSADYRLPHTGDSDPAGIPTGAVTAEDADLIAHLAAQGSVRMHLTLTPQRLPDETSYNVIGDLKGSEHPQQIVIVSGHLDSWDLGTGAIDDAAGVVMAIETAQLVQRLHLRPRRTLRVIAWMDEETDGAGANQYRKDNRAYFPNYIAAIESDVGAAHPFGFFVKMSKPAVDLLKPVQTVLGSIGASILQEASHPPGITDVAGMSDEGVPVLSIMQDTRNYYSYHHSAADTFDKVVPSELRENDAAMAVMAYALASMERPLPR